MNNNMEIKDSTTQRDSFTELLGQLVGNLTAVVHNEIELVIQGFREQTTAARSGIVIVAIGAAIGFAAFMSLCAAVIIGLSSYMSPVKAALVTGSALATVGLMIVFIGYKQLNTAILKT